MQKKRLMAWRKWWCGVLVVCGLLAVSTTCWGWKQLKSKSGKPLSWHKMPIQYAIDAKGLGEYFKNNPALGKESSEFAAIELAFKTWSSVLCPSGGLVGLTLQPLGYVTDKTPGTDETCDNCNTNLITFVTDKSKWTRPSTELAVALPVWRDLSGQIFDADILINAAHFTLSTQSQNVDDIKWDIQNAVTHEVGHLLGLDHTEDTKATMYARVDEKDISMRTLKDDDIAGICAIYPPVGLSQKVPVYETGEKGRGLGCQSGGVESVGGVGLLLLLLAFRRRLRVA
jgi:uncharacterized protein (TIGR03382 family)